MQSKILDLIGNSDKSVILSAPAREGEIASKSMIEILKRKHRTEVLIIDPIKTNVKIVSHVYETVCDRLSQKQEYLDSIWLVFPEYLATLSQVTDQEEGDFVNKLLYIASRGRAVNVAMLLVTQSLKVSDIRFPDFSWKNCFDIHSFL